MGNVQRWINPDAHLSPGGNMQPWIKALLAIDRRRNPEPLIRLLKSGAPMPDDARWHIADLLQRYNLKLAAGKNRQTASYDHSEAEGNLFRAAKCVHGYVAKQTLTKDEAIQRCARDYRVKPETLRTYLAGKHSSGYRIKKRRPPAIKSATSP
jgi:hypothetical protein